MSESRGEIISVRRGDFIGIRNGEADFEEYRRDRAFHAWKQAMSDAGLKLPTQVADGRAVCFCGATIGIDDMTRHVYTAHMEPKPPQ